MKYGFLALIFLVAIPFIGFEAYKYFGPRYQAVETKIFKESQAYNEGMVRDLENLKMQYETSNEEQRQVLRALILHRFSVYEKERLPANLERFYNQLMGN